MHFSGELLRPTSASHGTVPPSEPATRGRPTVLFWPPNPKACLPGQLQDFSDLNIFASNSFVDAPSKFRFSIPLSQSLTSPPKVPRNSGPAVGETVGKFSV